jgi:hypothetical protein
MAIAQQSKQSHDKTAAHASTGASQVGPGKQTMVQARAADAHGPAGGGVEAKAAKASGDKPRTKTETEAIFELGEYAQRVKDAFGAVEKRVGHSKNVQQAASTALGAVGSLLADKVGAEVGKGLGFVIGQITDKVSESLGEKFPEVEGDKNAATYLAKSERKLHHIIHSEAQHIPDHHASIHELHQLLKFLRSGATSTGAITKFVNQKLSDYQNSVELMYENPKDLNIIHNELVAESPVLGRVPDPARSNVPHLAVVQATKHNLPDAPRLTTWAVLRFVPNGLGPEANAVMDDKHPGQPILNFKLKVAGHVERGIVPVGPP